MYNIEKYTTTSRCSSVASVKIPLNKGLRVHWYFNIPFVLCLVLSTIRKLLICVTLLKFYLFTSDLNLLFILFSVQVAAQSL